MSARLIWLSTHVSVSPACLPTLGGPVGWALSAEPLFHSKGVYCSVGLACPVVSELAFVSHGESLSKMAFPPSLFLGLWTHPWWGCGRVPGEAVGVSLVVLWACPY